MKRLFPVLFATLLSASALADGIMLVSTTGYPQPFLKNLYTDIRLNIDGPMVETVVCQEFYNESSLTVDAVWNFPMPPEARSTKLLYWRNDSVFEARLKVAQQVTNPGTGEGGVAALVNAYIGKSGIRMEISDIPPHGIQKIEFHYFSLLDYSGGRFLYRYPLNTSGFVQSYINFLKVGISIQSRSPITGWDFPGYAAETAVLESDSFHLNLEMTRNKAWLASDLAFSYQISQDSLQLDHYCAFSDTMDSHFGLFVRPPLYEIPQRVLYKRILFLVGNATTMTGYKLEQSLAAISQALDSLRPGEVFNLAAYNNSLLTWQAGFMNVNPTTIASAKAFLQGIQASGGSDLNTALTSSLAMFPDSAFQNCILCFSDGHSVIDPVQLAADNPFKTAICFFGIGTNLDRERLEMTAGLNYGFVAYYTESNNLKEAFLRAFARINQPIMKEVSLQFNKPDVQQLVPQPCPSVYAASWFYVAGRYQAPGTNPFSIQGRGILDPTGIQNVQYDTLLQWATGPNPHGFPMYLWAKTRMDQLEQEILIYGEDPALKQDLINLSLYYKMKCRYTAYFQMEELGGDITEAFRTPLTEAVIQPLRLTPNPFTNLATLEVQIQGGLTSDVLLIRVFNASGKLVRVVDLTGFAPGSTEIRIDFSDLPGGLYYFSLVHQDRTLGSVKGLHIRL